MKCPRCIPFLKPGLALGAKRHDGFADAWNWLIHSFWHMTLGDGLKWVNKWQGYPQIHLQIEAGEGINVKYSGGKVIISTGDGETEEEEYSSGGGGSSPDNGGDSGSGGSSGGRARSSGGEVTRPDGAMTGGGGGTGSDSGAMSGGGASGGGASGDNGTKCNEFSSEIENDYGDAGMGNDGDDCSIINGW